MRGGIDGALQLGYQFRNGAAQVVSDMANGSPIMRLPRRNPNRLKQHGGGDVVGMGDKWDRHPATDGLIFGADLPRVPAGRGRAFSMAWKIHRRSPRWPVNRVRRQGRRESVRYWPERRRACWLNSGRATPPKCVSPCAESPRRWLSSGVALARCVAHL